ncbi:hypothetical protein R5R35_006751 [Gryllus longicercus]|uniref:Lysophospholipid acyltransferase 7 n=1 Tax=Gryllus longicercus TaxID=2509291 RepID=A0AAN9W2K9_9ORTH
MEWDDVIYLTMLFISIGLGHYFQKITDKNVKKWSATIIGILLVFVVSGRHILHPLVCTLVNALIVTFISKKSCHIVSFVFQFLYLLFFRSTVYFGIPYPPPHTNLVQMMLTLKLVGLAFEVHDSAFSRKVKNDDDKRSEAEIETTYINPGFLDTFHYAFSYVGVLTGPYHKYRTYLDWLESPFALYAPCKDATIQRLKYIPLYAGLFLLATYFFPISYADTPEFYEERSVLYRIWYINPMFFIFRMRIYTGLVLSECVCTMAGLGAYPILTGPKSGQGPSKNYEILKISLSDSVIAKKETYNFETIHNIDPYGSDFCVTFREAMKCWNSCIQYWLAVNIYKRCPMKQFRTFFTMFVSAYWHGVYAGYYLCLCSAPTYLPVEDLYVKLFYKDSTGLAKVIWDWVIWFFKMQAFSYMAVAFFLLNIEKIIFYWRSIYFSHQVMWIVLYGVGVVILKTRKRKPKQT